MTRRVERRGEGGREKYGVSSLPRGPTLGGMDSATPDPTPAEVDFSEGLSSASSEMRFGLEMGSGNAAAAPGGSRWPGWIGMNSLTDPPQKSHSKLSSVLKKGRRKREEIGI